MKQEKVSILMSIYNEPLSYVEKSINSILNQSYSNIEFIIIADDSNNLGVIKYINSINDSRIKFYIHKHNIGLVGSLNEGLKYCTGAYIARMDADDEALPNRIKEEFTFLKATDSDLVASNIINFDEKTGNAISVSDYPIEENKIKQTLFYNNILPHPTWFAKKSTFIKLSGYRNVKYCEDYDFLLRGLKVELKYGFVQQPLLRYRINNDGITRSHIIQQKIISYYLGNHFREGFIPSVKEINIYLSSTVYTHLESLINNLRSKSLLKLIKSFAKYKEVRAYVYYRLIGKFY